MALPGDLIAATIANTGVSIYDDLQAHPQLVYDLQTLQARLDAGLRGLNLEYPIRTRAKVAKVAVAELLGYAVPPSFKKTQPRFPGQRLDVFVQAANNLQIWNEEVDPGRRYALIRVGPDHVVNAVRVLTGEAIARLDHTGTLTTKFQAKRRPGHAGSILTCERDTAPFLVALSPRETLPRELLRAAAPISLPEPGGVLTIASLHERLCELEGATFVDPGLLQERNRGVAFQKMACTALGLGDYADAGQFPDIPVQAVEVKLQLSPTIDLGLVSPDSTELAQEIGHRLRHCDVRYVVAYASRIDEQRVRIDEIVTTTGAGFFDEFQRFEGKVINSKLQIPLPSRLFETE